MLLNNQWDKKRNSKKYELYLDKQKQHKLMRCSKGNTEIEIYGDRCLHLRKRKDLNKQFTLILQETGN